MKNFFRGTKKRLMDYSIITCVIGIVLFCLMIFFRQYYTSAFFFLVLSAAFVSVAFSRRAYLWSQNVNVRVAFLIVLFVVGVFMYCMITVDDAAPETCLVRPLSSANRVIASFFPSRGGFEGLKEESDSGQFLYYSYHFCAVSFVSMLLYSVFFGLYSIGYVKRRLDYGLLWRKSSSRPKKYTFWGDSEAARVLAKSVTVSGRKAIFQIARDSFQDGDMTKNMVLNLFKHQKCAVVFIAGLPDEKHDDFSEGERIHLDAIDVYSGHHFILGEDTRFNVRLAKAIVEARRANGFTDDVNLFVRVENSADEDLLCEWLDRNFDSAANVFVHVIRETELLAGKYIENFPLLGGRYPLIESDRETGLAKAVDGSENVKVLMIGFGCRGQELINVMIENSRFITGFEHGVASDGESRQERVISFSADVVAKNELCFLDYKNKSGITWDMYGLNAPYGALDINSAEFEEKVLSNVNKLNSYGRIIVCTGDDDLNISVASRICRCMKAEGTPISKGKLFIQLKSEEVYNRLVYQKAENEGDVENRTRAVISPFENVEFFGMWNEIFTVENIIRKEKHNKRDMWLNWYYCYESVYEAERGKEKNMWQSANDSIGKKYSVKNNKTGEEEERIIPSIEEVWRETEWFDKRSTLASCVGQRNLLALLGYEIVDEGDTRDAYENVFPETSPDVIMLMARNEHLRWMAFMHTHGVLPWDLNFPTPENVRTLMPPGKNGMKKIKANVRKVINRHAAIVPFDDLPAVDLKIRKFNDPSFVGGEECFTCRGLGVGKAENLQWNDIKFVRWIPELMRLCGKKIVKSR